MNLLQSVLVRSESRSVHPALSWDSFLASFGFNGSTYPLTGKPNQTLGFKQEDITDSYIGLARGALKGNPIIFALSEYRRKTFSQARFAWEEVDNDGPSGSFSQTSALTPLQRSNALLSRVSQHADLAGNAFVTLTADGLTTLRPDWVTIVAGSREYPKQAGAAIDARVIGILYFPGGKASGEPPITLLPNEYAHWAPTPDPDASFRGMSWVTPTLREVMGDNAATTHKLMYFENGATPNLVVSLDPAIAPDKFKAFVELFEQNHKGATDAYKTLYLGGGADVEVVGSDLKQLDFKVTQGAGESRMASDAGVHPVLVAFSEGLQGSSLNAGNYDSARRSYSDTTLWDLWGSFAQSMESLFPPPAGSRLWVDGRRIPFLQDDEKDRAETQSADATTISTLVTAGYTPESSIDAVMAGDFDRLDHSGLYSVQLQAPGTEDPAPVVVEPDRSVHVNVEPPAPGTFNFDTAGAERAIEKVAERTADQSALLIEAERSARIVDKADMEADIEERHDQVLDLVSVHASTVDAAAIAQDTKETIESQAAALAELRTALEMMSQPMTREVIRNDAGEVVEVVETRGDVVTRKPVTYENGRIVKVGT